MYLPNIRYIPAPFNQKLSYAHYPVSKENSQPQTANKDIVAAESHAKRIEKDDGMETALLVLLLMDFIS